jgi:aryl-alcohol dehydrogenase-like predicted oxidoreductase
MTQPKMNEYVTLGRSGLIVSPFCLGTMTFGNYRWGSSDEESRLIFDRYIEAGGNFLDCADGYAEGKSEEVLGRFIADANLRDRVVLATKFTFAAQEGNPNSGGNGRKNAHRALEGSLRRLGTDYVDLYWMHVWDTVTPLEEIVETLSTLVRAGKVRYYGFSDVPAWYVARAVTLAEARGLVPPIALQLEYSLVERNIEREHIPAALELGLGVCPWSPLASGFLSGKYTREGASSSEGSRLHVLKNSNNPVFDKFTERNWNILDAVQDVAKQTEHSAAQVALNWAATRPGVTSTIIGATKLKQLEDNLAALSFAIPPELRKKLDEASALEQIHPYMFFGEVLQDRVRGGVKIKRWG